MKKGYDLIAIGELLMDMTPMKPQGYLPNPGGAPANVAAMAAHLGLSVACVAKVGHDLFGQALIDEVAKHGVATHGIVKSQAHPTTLAFVQLDASGERQFSFYRKACADGQLTWHDVNTSLFENLKVLCYGSVSMAIEPMNTTLSQVLDYTGEKGTLLAYDPNYRPLLWDNEDQAKAAMLKGMNHAHVVKVSDEEALLLSGKTSLEEALQVLMVDPIQMLVITKGGQGVLLGVNAGCGPTAEGARMSDDHRYWFKSYKASQVSRVVDTTGAGDAFFGGLIGALIDQGLIQFTKDNKWRLTYADPKSLEEALNFAQTAAGICVEGFGAMPSLPTKAQVLERLNHL